MAHFQATPDDLAEIVRRQQLAALKRQAPYPIGALAIGALLIPLYWPAALVALGMGLAWALSTYRDLRSLQGGVSVALFLAAGACGRGSARRLYTAIEPEGIVADPLERRYRGEVITRLLRIGGRGGGHGRASQTVPGFDRTASLAEPRNRVREMPQDNEQLTAPVQARQRRSSSQGSADLRKD